MNFPGSGGKDTCIDVTVCDALQETGLSAAELVRRRRSPSRVAEVAERGKRGGRDNHTIVE